MNYQGFLLTATRIFRSASSSLWRNKVTLSFSVLALSLIFFLIHLTSFAGVFSGAFLQNIEKKVDIAVFLEQDVSDIQESIFRKALQRKKDQEQIADFWEFSKEDALEEFQRIFPEQTQFLQNYDIDNPLATEFGIVPLANESSLESLTEWILSPEFSGIVDRSVFQKGLEYRERVQHFLSMTSFAKSVIIISRILFLLVAFAIVFHFLSLLLRSKTREISIMMLVGARFSVIRTPFLIEGVVLALIAFLFGTLLFFLALSRFYGAFESFLLGLGIQESFATTLFSEKNILWDIIWNNAFFALLIAFSASWLVVSRALKRENLSDF